MVGRDEVVDDVLRLEELEEGRGRFVVKDLNFEVMAEVSKEVVGGEVSGTEVGSRTRDEGLHVNVAFIDGEQKVLGMVLGRDREATGKVREGSIASEIGRRGLAAATKDRIGKFVRVIVICVEFQIRLL